MTAMSALAPPGRPIADTWWRQVSSPAGLTAVVFGVLAVRVLAAMLLPIVRTPGWPDVVVLVVAVVAAVRSVLAARPSRARAATVAAALVFWLAPCVVAPVHGQDVPVVAAAMAAVAAALILGPPTSSAVVRMSVATGGLIVALSLLYGLANAVGLGVGGFHTVGDYQRAVGGIPALRGIALHPNTLGAIAALTLVVSLTIALANRRPGAFVIPALCSVALIWSQSRTGLGSAVIAVAALLLARRRPGAAPYLVGASLLLSVLPVLATWQYGAFVDMSGLVTGRGLAWGPALRLFQESPLIGFGPDALSREFWQTQPGQWWEPLHAHNQVLQAMAQAGLLGLTGLVALALAAARVALSRVGWNGALAVSLLVFVGAQSGVEVPLGLTYFPIALLMPATIVAAFAYAGSLSWSPRPRPSA